MGTKHHQLLPVALSATPIAVIVSAPTVQLSSVTQKQTRKCLKKSIAILASSLAAFSATMMLATTHNKTVPVIYPVNSAIQTTHIPALPVMVRLPPTVATKEIIAQARRFVLLSRPSTLGLAS
jgi:Na+/melibiose symporter-like transporter